MIFHTRFSKDRNFYEVSSIVHGGTKTFWVHGGGGLFDLGIGDHAHDHAL